MYKYRGKMKTMEERQTVIHMCDKYYTHSDFTIATLFIKKEKVQRCKENNNTNNMLCDRSVYFVTNNFVAVFFLRRFLRRRIMVKISLNNSLTFMLRLARIMDKLELAGVYCTYLRLYQTYNIFD